MIDIYKVPILNCVYIIFLKSSMLIIKEKVTIYPLK